MSQGAVRPVVADQPPTRRDELDLLRAVVVVGLVFFHTAVIFGAGEFPIKAARENRAATVFLGFGAAWGMPLLFLIAGMGIWYSLAIERWLLRHPRFQLHFTPTYSSWLNLVERWFAELTSKWL